MPALDFPIMTRREQLQRAAAARQRVRFAGAVLRCGTGHSGRYRNRWLLISTDAGLIRVTASQTSALGQAQPGTRIEFAARLTGMVDLTQDMFFVERAQVLRLRAQ